MRSFRARLTFWNVVVIAVVLVAFSAGIVFANQARISADIDRDLADRALHAPMPPGMGGPGGFGGGGQGGGGQGGQGGQGGGGQGGQGGQGGPPNGFDPRQDGPDPNFNPRSNDVPPRFNDPVAVRFADVRRPRRFDAQGQPLGQMQDEAFDPKALASALQGTPVYSNGVFGGEPIRIYSFPVRRGPNVGGVVQVARETKDLDQIWSTQLWTLVLFLPGALLGAAAGAFFLTSRATKPLAQMKQAANAISEKDLSQRLAIEGQDEFAELGSTFNAMIDRLEDSFTSLKAAYSSLEDAHETQKRFTADASHELRTPLTRLRLATSSALAESASPVERKKALEVADAAAQSMGRLVQEMLVLARADAGQLSMQKEKLDLRVVVTDVLEPFHPGAVDLVADLQDSPVTVNADPVHLHRVLTNLIENALRYTPAGGSVKVSACSDSHFATLKVSDTGEGIPAEHLPHITERFYRADASRSRADGGCGLGLAICRTIVEAHSGMLDIQSTVGQGTTVSIRLPIFS